MDDEQEFSPSPVLPRCHCAWPDHVTKAARTALREALPKCKRVQGSDIGADVVMEHVWNAICDAMHRTDPVGAP